MKVNNCGGKQQKRMIENGWKMVIADFGEAPEELHKRLVASGWKQVKVYWCGTRIRGLHDYFAFVK